MTQRIRPINPTEAQGQAKSLLDAVAAQLGGVPNIIKTFAQSPAVLQGYLGFSDALSKGTLDARLREQIALAVAGSNGCDYCASAHSFLAKKTGVDSDEVIRNLKGEASDARTDAALQFAKALVAKRARVTDDELEAVRSAGFSGEEVVEIIGNVALNLFTNYFNHVADTEIDFPVVNTGTVAPAA
ncbi:MAG: carboxymuconolactone decarboxylase family protein [Gammaproteobacteria bacterium]|nr:carboxymuconolactone decarboxylase family protein [Gammaproteobacteria bacterium]